MKPPRLIKTRRLTLRPFTLRDAPAVFKSYAQDPEVTRFLYWQPHKSVSETRAFLETCRQSWKTGDEFIWAMTTRTGALVGSIGLILKGCKAEVGYVIARHCWGRGYATEAARTVVRWALAQPDTWRVWATCDADNRASARVLEKAGMQLEGVLRNWIIRPQLGPAPRDALCYSLVKPRTP